MARYLGPKVRLSRRVGVPIADVPKHTKGELTIPGVHGFRGRRSTEYGLRLTEKQKLRFHYCVGEKQFRRFLGQAQKSKGNTGDSMVQLLETRLDNVCRRLGVARTIWAARQMVVHGHVLVNGKKVDRPSYSVAPGMVITFKEKVVKLIRENMESMPGHNVSGWIEFNPAKLEAKILALPKTEDVPFGINMNLIIELYQ
jgi:small subunit ribosomal protein S4